MQNPQNDNERNVSPTRQAGRDYKNVQRSPDIDTDLNSEAETDAEGANFDSTDAGDEIQSGRIANNTEIDLDRTGVKNMQGARDNYHVDSKNNQSVKDTGSQKPRSNNKAEAKQAQKADGGKKLAGSATTGRAGLNSQGATSGNGGYGNTDNGSSTTGNRH